MVNRPTDSAPGPDGIPFAAWRAAPDLSALLLHRVFEVIAKGHSPPEGFNHGLLYLLPKKDTGLVSDTRPLSVTNTDNRILAAAVSRSIMPAVDKYEPSTNGIVVRAGNVKLMGSTSAGSSPGSARIFVLGHGVKIKKNIFSSNPRRLSTL